jgi:TM2 domain-containing membrane protein YozV
MPTAKLHFSEPNDLPPVCVRCGCASTQVKAEEFSWSPLWARLIFSPLLRLLLTDRKATVHLPFCEKHFWGRLWIGKVFWGGLALAVVLIALGFCMHQYMNLEIGQGVIFAGFVTVGIALLVLWFGDDGSPRATCITSKTITLDQVSQEYSEAVRNGVAPGSASGRTGEIELQTAKYFRAR